MDSVTVSIISAGISAFSLIVSGITLGNNIYKEWIKIEPVFELHYSPVAMFEHEINKYKNIPELENGALLARIKVHNNSKLDVGFTNFHISFEGKDKKYYKLKHIGTTKTRFHVVLNPPASPQHNKADFPTRIDTSTITDGIGTFKAVSWTAIDLVTSLLHQDTPGSVLKILDVYDINDTVRFKVSFETIKPRNLFFFNKPQLKHCKTFDVKLNQPFHDVSS